MKKYFIHLSQTQYAGEMLCKKINQKNINWLKDKIQEEPISIEEILQTMEKNQIKILDNPFPEINDSPPFLYIKGNGPLTNKRVAIIGSRKCSDYGKKIAEELAYKLAKRGVTIISGLAYGIDKAAHIGALKGGGVTVGVLGSGILNCYPKEHQWLYDKIVRNGFIISEYGLYTPPLSKNFPFRNRIISGLSTAIVVVEANMRSGTMITVRHGLNQGKDIFVIPGSIYSPLSKGTNQLIQEGASIIVDLDEFIEQIVKP
ncbi:MAG: DNA-processing protein DprA [Clostridia bacterium]|nr:DNA-processing protein DprA [Clostridia bacterium]